MCRDWWGDNWSLKFCIWIRIVLFIWIAEVPASHWWAWCLQFRFPCRCMPDQICSLHDPVRHTDSPLICCRSISCTLWCTYLSQLVPRLNCLPLRGQIVVLTVQQWSTYLSKHSAVEKLCQTSWMSDKNVELNNWKSYANCSYIDFYLSVMFVVWIHFKAITVIWEIAHFSKQDSPHAHLLQENCAWKQRLELTLLQDTCFLAWQDSDAL